MPGPVRTVGKQLMEGVARRREAAVGRAKARREGLRYGAFSQGHRDYREGLSLEDCPYASRVRAQAWRNGWRYAEAES